MLLWFTGLSGAGKSTLADLVEQKLLEKGFHTYLLDGDDLRGGMCKDLGFTQKDRKENIRRAAETAKLLVDAGLVVLGSFISPFRADRDFVRSLFKKEEFVEIFVDCDLETCQKRDTKGLYQKADQRQLKNVTGIDSPYEKPLHPELTIHSAKDTPQECVASIMQYLKKSLIGQNNLEIPQEKIKNLNAPTH